MLKRETEVQPYAQLAFIYDHVMRHVQYGKWAAYLAGLFEKAGRRVEDVLDISCGTGSLMLELQRLGFRVNGFDVSHEMIRIAQQKFRRGSVKLPVWCGSMQQVSVSRRYDAIVSNYDSINYCMDAGACLQVFENVACSLKTGGLFVFDICTEKNSKQHFRNFFERDGADEFEYVRQAYYNSFTRVQVNEFSIHWSVGDSRHYLEVHHQRIYKIDELKALVPETKYELIGIYDGFSRRQGTENSDRVHFVLRRK